MHIYQHLCVHCISTRKMSKNNQTFSKMVTKHQKIVEISQKCLKNRQNSGGKNLQIITKVGWAGVASGAKKIFTVGS